MDFHILGPLEVRDDRGETASVGGGKQRSLLALLLIHPNEPLATDRLIDELWGEEPPLTAAKIIQNHVSQLRRVLGDDRLQTLARGYAFRVGPGELDVDRFRQRLADARRRRPQVTLRCVAGAARSARDVARPSARRVHL